MAYPYKVGEAIYHITEHALTRPLTLRAGVIRRDGGDGSRLNIRWADGRTSTVRANMVGYRGHCTHCLGPVHEIDGLLICPHCGCEGDPLPPPDKELIRLFGNHSM